MILLKRLREGKGGARQWPTNEIEDCGRDWVYKMEVALSHQNCQKASRESVRGVRQVE